MKGELSVLVLGVGGNVSQGILKALRLATLPCRVIGACISPDAAGLYTADQAYISPRFDAPSFPDWLIDVCRRERVQAVLSGTEPVLGALSSIAPAVKDETGAICIVSSPRHLKVGGDKLQTVAWLREHGFDCPRSADARNPADVDSLVRACGFPLLAKPRAGKGSVGVRVIGDARQLACVTTEPDYVLQEYLGDDDHEYTAATFSDAPGLVRGAIVFRRTLTAGTTSRAEAGLFSDVRAEAVRIAQEFRPMGPLNIQVRTAGNRVVCFEMNVRFSGTTPIRARLGFNDVEAALRHYVLNETAKELPLVTSGLAIRYWNEVYPDRGAAATIRTTGRLDDPKHTGTRVEDYGV